VRDLVRGAPGLGDMDLAYCSGLMESLPDAAAAGLAHALFGMLRPGGALVITQFLAGLTEAAFLEAFMDWHMVYRRRDETVGLVRDLIGGDVNDWNYIESPEATLGVLTVRRR
jgi:hypothetical protein